MGDLSKKVSDATAVFSGTLSVGNHDSVTLYGIHAQNKLKDYSRKVSALLLKETDELDKAIADVIAEIERFEGKANLSFKSIWGKNRQHKDIVKEYNKIFSYVENITVYFKLQQAQLMKEIKLLEKLAESVNACSDELESCIEIGKQVLEKRPLPQKADGGLAASLLNDSDYEIWYSRLSKRIDDLSVSHTVSLQNQAQIRMLHDNDLVMLDKIASAITNTFPIWQNQMAVLLGIDLLESRNEAYNQVITATNRIIRKTSGRAKAKSMFPQGNSLNTEDVLEVTSALRNALSEVVLLEKNDGILRNEFQKTLHRVERGQDYE